MRKVVNKDKKVLFKANKSNLRKISRTRKRSTTLQKINIKRILLVVLILGLLSGCIYLFSKIFSNKENIQKTTDIPTVLGLENVPVFPNSTFLYEGSEDNQVVKDMLANGQSAYKLTDRSSFNDVKEYYANQLTSKGWTLVLDIPIGSEDKKYGQYWTNDEKGLRIYNKYSDIWYEYITIEEAQNGLSNRISDEIEIDMLIAGSDYQDLLPDYPWQVKVPKEYLISYKVVEFEDLRAVSFQRISTGAYITIYPIGYWGAKALDYQLDDYTEDISTDEVSWEVSNTSVTSFQGISSISGTITSGTDQRSILMLKNSYNAVTYVMSIQDTSDPLYEYLIENLTCLGSDEEE